MIDEEIRPISYAIDPILGWKFTIRVHFGFAQMVRGLWSSRDNARNAIKILEANGKSGALYFAFNSDTCNPKGIETVLSIHGIKLSCFGSVLTGGSSPIKGADLVKSLTKKYGEVECSAPRSLAYIRPVSNGWQVYLKNRSHYQGKIWVFSTFPTLESASDFRDRLKNAVMNNSSKGLEVDITRDKNQLFVHVSNLPEVSSHFGEDFLSALDYSLALRGASFPDYPETQHEEVLIEISPINH